MKIFLFALLMLACILEVKAQQSPRLPDNKRPLLNFKFKPDTSLAKLFKGNADSLTNGRVIASLNFSNPLKADIDHMTIVKLNNTDPNMPIVQTDRTGYTMPVIGMDQPKIYNMKRSGTTVKQLP